MQTIFHGTLYTYNRLSCRCDECREAVRLYAAERRAVAASTHANLTHGLESSYGKGCRCSECKRARVASSAARAAGLSLFAFNDLWHSQRSHCATCSAVDPFTVDDGSILCRDCAAILKLCDRSPSRLSALLSYVSDDLEATVRRLLSPDWAESQVIPKESRPPLMPPASLPGSCQPVQPA